MKTMSLLLAVLGLVVFGTTASGAGDSDLSKVLVGKWAGEIAPGPKDRNMNYDRTLVIGQIQEQDGKWIVQKAWWGVTGSKLVPIQVTVEVNGGAPTIQFEFHSANGRGWGTGVTSAKLSLTEGLLMGTLHLGGVGPNDDPMRQLKLKKVE
jgi:hypothetical protein